MRLTRHARRMLTERDISLDWVGRVLEEPQWVEPDPAHAGVWRAFGQIAERGDRILRVVYIVEDGGERVITAFFDRDARQRRAGDGEGSIRS